MLDLPGRSLLDALRQGLSRREALAGALGLAALSLTAEADAKNAKNKNKKRRQKKKKKKDKNCKAAGNTMCNGACVNTNSDASNCGACFTFCAEGQVCAAGVCTVPCGDVACISNQIDAGQAVSSVAAMPNGDLAMLAPGDSQILVLTTAGKQVKTVGGFGTGPGEFWNPMDLSVGGDGTYYVAEYRGGSGANAGRIQAIPPTGSPVLTAVNFARNVAAGPTPAAYYGGDFWWINRINGDGVTPYYWGYTGNCCGNSNRSDNITGLAVSASGTIFAVNGNDPDQGGETVGMVYSFTDGGSVPVTVNWGVGGLGSGPGLFNNASGIAVAGNRVFIADTDNRRVQVLNAAGGAYLFQWQTTDRLGNLIKPESIAVAPNGVVWVTADATLYGYTLVN